MRAAQLALGWLALAAPLCAQTIAAPDPAVASPPRLVLPDQSHATFHRDGLHSIYFLFQRRPTLMVCWRADDAAGARQVIPAALALADSFQGDLALLFVERSGRSYADMLRFAARERWLGGTAAWTCEVPEGAATLPTPSFVLISAKQATLLAGDPVAQRAELAAAAQRAVEQRRQGGSAALDADELENERVWCNEMLAQGTGAAAQARVEAMCKALAPLPRDDARRRQADEALEIYTCGDQNTELKASADMLDLQQQLFAKGPSAALAKSLQKCAKAHAGTHAAERAAFLATIAAP